MTPSKAASKVTEAEFVTRASRLTKEPTNDASPVASNHELGA